MLIDVQERRVIFFESPPFSSFRDFVVPYVACIEGLLFEQIGDRGKKKQRTVPTSVSSIISFCFSLHHIVK